MTAFPGEAPFDQQLELRERDIHLKQRIELCNEALELGLPDNKAVEAYANLGTDQLQMGNNEEGISALEKALTRDAQLQASVFADRAKQKAYLPALETAYLGKAQSLRKEQGTEAVQRFVTEKLQYFQHLKGPQLPALLVELGAAYQAEARYPKAYWHFRRAVKAEALAHIEETAVHIARSNMPEMKRKLNHFIAGNLIILAVILMIGAPVLVWLAEWLISMLPYVLSLAVIYYFGHQLSILLPASQWPANVLWALAIAAVLGAGVATLSYLLGLRNAFILMLIGLGVVTVVAVLALELWVYRRHRSSDPAVHPLIELKTDIIRHGQTFRNKAETLIRRLDRTLVYHPD